jgi:hypothetical protein
MPFWWLASLCLLQRHRWSPPNAAIGAASGTALLAVLAWYKRCRAAAPFSTFCVICFGLVLSGVPYFQAVLALGLLCYAGVVRVSPGYGEQPRGLDGDHLTRPSAPSL